MECTPFLIDNAKDDENENDSTTRLAQMSIRGDGSGGAFLEAHDSGLTEADKEVMNGKLQLLQSGSISNSKLGLHTKYLI